MPFVYDDLCVKKILKKCYSLQVQKSNNRSHKKRASLCSELGGSLTLEAAIVLPIFLLVVISITYFMVIMNIQLKIQVKIEECARKTAKQEYLTENITGYSYLTLEKNILSKDFKEYLDNTYIIDGAEGINLFNSSFRSGKGLFDIVVNYKIKIPFLPDSVIVIPCVQRCRFHSWTGQEISAEKTENSQIVYITATGGVYHTNRNCSHLKLSIKKCLYSELSDLRNENGEKYEQCSICKTNKAIKSTYVYITDDGDKWHNSISCSGLKRMIMEVDITEVGDKRLCERCRGGN